MWQRLSRSFEPDPGLRSEQSGNPRQKMPTRPRRPDQSAQGRLGADAHCGDRRGRCSGKRTRPRGHFPDPRPVRVRHHADRQREGDSGGRGFHRHARSEWSVGAARRGRRKLQPRRCPGPRCHLPGDPGRFDRHRRGAAPRVADCDFRRLGGRRRLRGKRLGPAAQRFRAAGAIRIDRGGSQPRHRHDPATRHSADRRLLLRVLHLVHRMGQRSGFGFAAAEHRRRRCSSRLAPRRRPCRRCSQRRLYEGGHLVDRRAPQHRVHAGRHFAADALEHGSHAGAPGG